LAVGRLRVGGAALSARAVLNIARARAIMLRDARRGRGVGRASGELPALDFRAAAMCLPATLLHAALSTEPEVSGRTSFAGQLLIASPDLRQPAFDHAVILLARHSRGGAVGIVINRMAEKRPIAGLLAAFGADASGVTDSVRVFVGGPVQPAAGFVLHSAEYHRPETLDIDGRVALTVAPDVLGDIGRGKGPTKSLIAFGYAGWAPGQLEGELTHGVWVMVPEDPALVFDTDRAEVWTEALALYKGGR
jgi:putative transcriptional regulator